MDEKDFWGGELVESGNVEWKFRSELKLVGGVICQDVFWLVERGTKLGCCKTRWRVGMTISCRFYMGMNWLEISGWLEELVRFDTNCGKD